jgi:hypothetical protein
MSNNSKVTVVEVWIRLMVIIAPLVGPYLLDMSKDAKVAIPVLWLMCMGPFFLILIKSIEQWEDGAKPYYWIFAQLLGYIWCL